MYNIVNGLQGGLDMPKPKFQIMKEKQEELAAAPKPKPCHKVFFESLKSCGLRLRAALLIILACLGIPAFYVTLNVLLNPGLASLEARFQPATCVVVSSIIKRGKVNCSWSSCRQGCTAQELYTCWQVLIAPHKSVPNVTNDFMVSNLSIVHGRIFEPSTTDAILEHSNDKDSTAHPQNENLAVVSHQIDYLASKNEITNQDIFHKNHTENTETISPPLLHLLNNSFTEDDLARLKINAAGCAYTPCSDWWEEYGKVGTTFSCYVGATGQLAIPDFDANQTAIEVTLGALPLVLCFTSVILIYVLYCRKGHTDQTLNLSPEPAAQNAKKMEEVRAQLLKEMAEGKRKIKKKKTAADFWAIALKSNHNAKVNPAIGSLETLRLEDGWDDDSDSNLPDPIKKWRHIAVKAVHHPSVSPARKFHEVEIDYIEQ